MMWPPEPRSTLAADDATRVAGPAQVISSSIAERGARSFVAVLGMPTRQDAIDVPVAGSDRPPIGLADVEFDDPDSRRGIRGAGAASKRHDAASVPCTPHAASFLFGLAPPKTHLAASLDRRSSDRQPPVVGLAIQSRGSPVGWSARVSRNPRGGGAGFPALQPAYVTVGAGRPRSREASEKTASLHHPARRPAIASNGSSYRSQSPNYGDARLMARDIRKEEKV